MRRGIATFVFSALSMVLAAGPGARTAAASGWLCPDCPKATVFSSASLVDLEVYAMSSYSTWGSGTVKLKLTNGSGSTTILLDGIDPSDLASGFSLADIDVDESFDLTVSALTAELLIDSTTHGTDSGPVKLVDGEA